MPGALAFPVVGFIAGAAVGLTWPELPSAVLFAVACGWLAFAVHAARVKSRLGLAACVCGVCLTGGIAAAERAWLVAWRPTLRVVWEAAAADARRAATGNGRILPEDDVVTMVVEGRLRADGALGPTGAVSLSMDAEWIGRTGGSRQASDGATNPVQGGLLVTVLGSLTEEHVGDWRAGRRIRVTADLRRPARYLDPGVPDQERLLARRGVSLVGTVKSAALVDVLARGRTVDELAARARAYARMAIASSVAPWSPRAAGIVSAIVIGDRTGLDDDVERRLQESGTYHVIAISGGNIAILAGLTLAAFRVAGLLGRVAMLSAAAGLVVYGFVVGGGASVDRAVLMAVVYFVGRAWDLRGPPHQALLLAAGVLAVRDPLSVADPASLLTFGATAAIVSTARLATLDVLPAFLQPALAMFVASASAEILLLPVSAFLFSRVTLAGLVLNFGAIPLMALAQLAGMAVVVLYAFWPDAARLAGWLAHVGAEGLVTTAGLVAYIPWSTWRVPAPSSVAIALYYSALVCSWWLWRTTRAKGPRTRGPHASAARAGAMLVAGCTAVWIATGSRSPLSRADGSLHVTFLDVGQGDAALVRFPRGSSALIDTGGLGGRGSFDIGDRVVAPVLRSTGVRRLGMLMLTHGDADHIGGAASVMREFMPWDVWDGVPVPPFEPMKRLREIAAEVGVRWTTVQRADATVIDDVRLEVRHPGVPDWERQDVRNDDSIVVELRWRDVSLVFTGDIGRATEAEIASLFAPAPLRLLKVPHHGSATSSTARLVESLAPDVAVVSVGRSNPFGHPAPGVLARYASRGTAVFRTDRDGAVSVDSDGRSLIVRTFSGRTLAVRPRRDVSRSVAVE